MGRLQKEALDNVHEKMFLEIKDSEEQKFRDELDLLEKKHRLEKLKKEKGGCQGSGGERAACGGWCNYWHYRLFSFSFG